MDFEVALRMLFHMAVITSVQAATIARLRGASLEQAVEVGLETYADLLASGDASPTDEDLGELEVLLWRELKELAPLGRVNPPRSLQ